MPSGLPDSLVDWEARLADGRPLLPEEFFADCPEMLEAVKRLRDGEETIHGRNPSEGDPSWRSGDVRMPSEVTASEREQYLKEILGALLGPPETTDEIGRIGPYRVLNVLGAGGMGVVFKAQDLKLKRFVAIKAMLPAISVNASAKARFLREAQAAAALKHDHIVCIHQVDEVNNVPYLAMEFLEGESLDQCLQRVGRLQVDEVLRIGCEIADGLAAAHDQGLVHRDIKPANIWLEARSLRRRGVVAAKAAGGAPPTRSTPRVKILDFGLARLDAHPDQPGEVHTQLTRSGVIVGTPAYMSPEQARGLKVDARCDLYSLGVVLYRMATGEVPFKGSDAFAVLSALAFESPVEPRTLNTEVPIPLNDLILKLLSKDANDRPTTAHDVIADLEEIEWTPSNQPAAVSVAAANTNATGPSAKNLSIPHRSLWRSRRFLAAGICGLALVALILGIVLTRPGVNSDPPVVAGMEITNSIGMKFVAIPAGKFFMGSPEKEKDRDSREDLHEVEITKGFWLGKFEVTQDQYARVMESNPSHFQGPGLPVENVSWDDAKQFCVKLSAIENKEYRLPSEAEWEYACRAGTEGPFSTGEDLTTDQANYNGDFSYAGTSKGLNRGKTMEVGSFPVNGFGLHDMHGNLSEWCEDSYAAYERKQPVRDPKGRPFGASRVIRGGSWQHSAAFCRSAKRDSDAPVSWSKLLGFRVAVSATK